jgi:hypothetical protein
MPCALGQADHGELPRLKAKCLASRRPERKKTLGEVGDFKYSFFGCSCHAVLLDPAVAGAMGGRLLFHTCPSLARLNPANCIGKVRDNNRSFLPATEFMDLGLFLSNF